MDTDSTFDEPTSDYEDSINPSEFTTLKSSARMNFYENGRRYRALMDRYGLPNDDAEQLREGMKHTMYVDYIFDGKLFSAPVKEYPQKIVDLGTGVGFWAMDVAEKYPSARVIGTDLSPIQPTWAPPNLEWRIEDLEDRHRPWTSIYRDADLIHMRSLLQTIQNPKKLFENAFANLAPGGWIECHDNIPHVYSTDGTVDDNHPLNTFYKLVNEAFSKRFQWDIMLPLQIPAMLREAGFINVVETKNAVPIGRWHRETKMRELGMFHHSITIDVVSAVMAKHAAMDMDAEEATRFTDQVKQALDNPRIHGIIDWSGIWAQKPLT